MDTEQLRAAARLIFIDMGETARRFARDCDRLAQLLGPIEPRHASPPSGDTVVQLRFPGGADGDGDPPSVG